MMTHLPPFAKAMLGLYAVDSAMPIPGVYLDVNFIDLTREIQALEHVDDRSRYQMGLQLLTEAGEERFKDVQPTTELLNVTQI
ncbi:MAG: hypothetical protein ACAF41_11855 [Leptolyngbya sp. BL-A-14]